jgi:demethylmenaquinone methyltransferase/2-methoxy-6-polyprenyl-1,4-benzoquinol methylase
MSVSSPTDGSPTADATEAAGTGASRSSGTLPEPQVQAMFDRIARVYDRMNGVMTAGLHHAWRRRAADLAELEPGGRVLDIATGTGDLAFELGHRVAPEGLVVGADFSENMLDIARAKREALRRVTSAPAGVELRFEQANALALPYGDDEFDAATVGFGARNFSDLPRGLSELARVVRPGGKVVVLEITTPTEGVMALALQLWFDRLVPLVGRVAGDADAYNYLPSSVRRFPPPHELARTMAACGLDDVRYILTAGGIIALHVGTVRG